MIKVSLERGVTKECKKNIQRKILYCFIVYLCLFLNWYQIKSMVIFGILVKFLDCIPAITVKVYAQKN